MKNLEINTSLTPWGNGFPEAVPLSASETAANTVLFSRYAFRSVIKAPLIIGSVAIVLGDISTRARLLSIALIVTSLALIILEKYALGLILWKPTQPPSNELPLNEPLPAALPEITVQNFLPLLEPLARAEENKPSLLESECVNILFYLRAHQNELIAQAKSENSCVRVKAHDHPDLPRTILVTPEGKIFVVLNRTKSKGDQIVGDGTFKVVKRCFELTEKKMCTHATFKNSKKPELEDTFLKKRKQEISFLNHLKGEPHFLQLLATDTYISKQGATKCSIITPYYNRGNLSSVLKTTRFSVHEKEAFCLKIALAIQRMHSLGHAHCDIKPENILVDGNDNPVLIDFESSLPITEENRRTIVGTMLSLHPVVTAYRKARREKDKGTELILQKRLPSLTSRDVWALGALFLRMANPKKPLPWAPHLTVADVEKNLINFLEDPSQPVFPKPKNTTSLEYLAWNMLQVDAKRQWTLDQVISFLQNNPA